MKASCLIFSMIFFLNFTLHAEGEPLNVAVSNFSPPFVMRGANNQVFGFDIAMMDNLCKLIQRTCKYQPMPFADLLTAVVAKDAEVAIGDITITSERAEKVNFSTPYLASNVRFIASKNSALLPFSLNKLANQKIGVVEGSVFTQIITSMGIKNPSIIVYKRDELIIAALADGSIDVALMDAPTAFYWKNEAPNHLSLIGEPFTYGFGLGIAVNKQSLALLQAINSAIVQYQNSVNFRQDYDKYLSERY